MQVGPLAIFVDGTLWLRLTLANHTIIADSLSPRSFDQVAAFTTSSFVA
jgi:hypothetical protein